MVLTLPFTGINIDKTDKKNLSATSPDPIKVLEDLHQKYSGVIFYKCKNFLTDGEEAKDAVQETFLSAYKALDRFDKKHTYLAWLYQIATNVCLKILRKRKRGKKAINLTRNAELSFSPQEEGKIMAREIIETVVNELDEREQVIFVSYFIDGLSQGQIAENLGISRRTVVKKVKQLRLKALKLKVF